MAGFAGQLSPEAPNAIRVFAQVSTGPGELRLEVADTGGQPFNWDQLAINGTPSGSTQADWAARVARARSRIGNNWTDVMAVLRGVANKPGMQPGRLADFNEYLRFVVTVYGSNAEEFGMA